ncbi:MAG: AbrB/MazE/SpoVT family DNA-binding domain-containing protein [Candidatus Bipolaricaulia bacterium]
MPKIDSTKVSSKGQIVIPKHLREELDLHQGDNLILVKKGDTLILRKMTLKDIAKETDRQQEEGETLTIEEAFEGLS